MTDARAALFLLAWCLVVGSGRGESYQFSNVAVPEPKSLHALYRFYVYAGQDNPLENEAQPYVEFNTYVEVPSSRPRRLDGTVVEDQSIQLSLIPVLDFWTLVDPESFCSTQNTLLLQSGPTPDGRTPEVRSITVPIRAADAAGGAARVRFNITRTDVYALMISNCGSISDAKILGSVTAANAFGYLPGDQYYKMQFYGLMTALYIFLAVLWFTMICSSRRKGKQLHHLHFCMSYVTLLGVVESFFSWYFLYDWNNASRRPEVSCVINVVVSVFKPLLSYAIVLITGFGFGVTRSDLECRQVLTVVLLLFPYCIIHLLWEVLSVYRHPYAISTNLLAPLHVVGLLVNLFLFLWMLIALGKTAESLEGESRSLFKRIRRMLILGYCASLPATAVQLLDLSGALTEDLLPSRTAFKWHYQWFVFDGTGQIIFVAVFIGVLCEWAPHKDTSKYLYAAHLSQNEDDDAPPGAFAIEGHSEDEADDPEADTTGRGDDGRVRPEPGLTRPQPDYIGSQR